MYDIWTVLGIYLVGFSMGLWFGIMKPKKK